MAEETPAQKIMRLFIGELTRRLEDDEERKALKAADFEMIRKLMADNSVTLASVQRGDFGETARKVAEEFPFPDEDQRTFQ